MFKNHLKTALRFLMKYKGFSLINIFGLAIGMACCILVSLFILDELSYDKQNKDAPQIYRVVQDLVNDDDSKTPVATTPPAIAVAIQKDIPEIEHVVRLFPRGWDNNYYVRNGEKKFIEENICRADSSIFDVFTIPFKRGNAKTAMAFPNSIILTESMAKKYFGKQDPIGKILNIDDWQPCIVTAIIRDIPGNTHFKMDFLLALRSGPMGEENANWNWNSFYTYIKLKPGSDITAVDKKIRSVFKKNQPQSKNYLYSQPLTTIHLGSHLESELRPNSDKSYIYIFGTISFFILLIASVNYINLTTAQSSLRAKEIGIRKVSGALKTALIRQFLTEATIFSLIAAVVAIGLTLMLLPAINNITGKELSVIPYGNYFIISLIPAFALLIGLSAGLYPALYLSSFEPVRVLKGEKRSDHKGLSLRKILVVTQFAISIALIVGTIVIIRQMNFILQAKLGLDKDHVIIVNDIYYLEESQRTALKNELLQTPGVKKVAAVDGVPGGQTWARNVRYRGSQSNQPVNSLSIDEDFISALNIQLKQGRNFHQTSQDDTIKELILNETAVRDLGVPAPVIGQQIFWSKNIHTGQISYATIVGVVKDFHFTSMRTKIKPFVFVNNNNRQWKYMIKMNGANMPQILENIKNVWDKNVKSRPFQYAFLDETYANLYKAEMNFKKIFTFITFIAIFISCLGLFALSLFITELRTKEIGIRKVLGASVANIAGMLSKEFVKLIVIAAAISFPLAWWIMAYWLQAFAYKINISVWIFAIVGLFTLLIALITICFHTIKAATGNPVKSLKSE